MTVLSHPGTSAAAVRHVLVVMLLVLAASLTITIPEGAAGPSVHVVSAVEHHVPAVGDAVVVVVGDHPDHGGEALGMLCLCALLVTGIDLAARRAPTYRVSLSTMVPVGDCHARAQAIVRSVPHDPVLWGVSRT